MQCMHVHMIAYKRLAPSPLLVAPMATATFVALATLIIAIAVATAVTTAAFIAFVALVCTSLATVRYNNSDFLKYYRYIQ